MLIHASCILFENKAVLLRGASGMGKSDLALRLIDAGAELISDDQTCLQVRRHGLYASPPEKLKGLIEVRNIGLLRLPFKEEGPVALSVELVPSEPERLPPIAMTHCLSIAIRHIELVAVHASAVAKIHAVLRHLPATDL